MSTDEQSVKDDPETVAWEEFQQNPSQGTKALQGDEKFLQKDLW